MANPRRRPIVPFVLFSLALAALGCSSDKGSIFAPSGAVLALRLLNPAITVNGSTTVIVSANQAGGAPVEDGTELAVTAATGTLHQAKLRTVSGKASVTYVAGPEVGLDQISASTGSAQALLSVRISSAVATSIQLSSRPDSLPTGGGTATITAVLTGAGGAPVAGGEVLFTTSSGTVNATSVVTDTEGKAAIAIETVEPAMIEAAIEGGPSAEYLLGVRGALIVRVTRRPAEPQVGDTVTFTVTPLQPGDTTPTGRVMVSFGDDKNFQQRTEGRATVTHVYRAAGTFSAEVEFVADNGDRARTTATVVVAPIPITYAVAVSASPAQPQTGDLVTFTVTATQSDGGRPSGQVTVAYGDGATHQQAINGTATMSHVYTAAGSFNTVVQFIAPDGTTTSASVTVVVQATPPPPPPPGPNGNDEIDLSSVIWLHHNVSGWDQTSTITNISHSDPPICIDHTKAGAWPAIDDGGTVVEGNPWVFAQIDGQWYAGTYEWLRPGQICKSIDAGNIAGHIKIAPLSSWKPRSGEVVGFMVSTPARFGPDGPKHERSNVVRFVWP